MARLLSPTFNLASMDAELRDVIGLAVFWDYVQQHGTSGLWGKHTRDAQMDPDLQVFRSPEAIANTSGL